MQTGKKKPALPWLLAGAVLAGYLGYMLGGIWKEGITYVEFMERLSAVCERPLANYWSAYSLKLIAFAELIYAMAMLMYYTSGRNLMPGKEHGTARLEPPAQAARLLEDKDPERNRILSKNVYGFPETKTQREYPDLRRLRSRKDLLLCKAQPDAAPQELLLYLYRSEGRDPAKLRTDAKGQRLSGEGHQPVGDGKIRLL